jgi:hypothetical protein
MFGEVSRSEFVPLRRRSQRALYWFVVVSFRRAFAAWSVVCVGPAKSLVVVEGGIYMLASVVVGTGEASLTPLFVVVVRVQ